MDTGHIAETVRHRRLRKTFFNKGGQDKSLEINGVSHSTTRWRDKHAQLKRRIFFKNIVKVYQKYFYCNLCQFCVFLVIHFLMPFVK